MFIYSIETIMTASILAIIILFSIYGKLAHWLKYRNCLHAEVRETMACNAVCRNCDKNLGFIGAWRAKNNPPTQE